MFTLQGFILSLSEQYEDKGNKPRCVELETRPISTGGWQQCLSYTFDNSCFAVIEGSAIYYHNSIYGVYLARDNNSSVDILEYYGMDIYTSNTEVYRHYPRVTSASNFSKGSTVYLFVKWNGSGNENPAYLKLLIFEDYIS